MTTSSSTFGTLPDCQLAGLLQSPEPLLTVCAVAIDAIATIITTAESALMVCSRKPSGNREVYSFGTGTCGVNPLFAVRILHVEFRKLS